MFKNLMNFAFLLMIGASIISISSCGDDDPVTPVEENVGPTVKILDSSFSDTLVTTDTSALYKLNVQVDTGSIALKTFTIYRDGVKLGTDDFLINDSFPSSNPFSILDANDVNGFTWDVTIRTQNTYDTQTYTIEVADENGLSASDEIVVIVNEPVVTTPITFDGSGFQFWNNAGENFGGINVLDGSEQSTVSGAPHIIDGGNDAVTWKKIISPATGIDLRRAADGITVDFAAIETMEEIADLYEGGVILSESAPISVGDVFFVKVGAVISALHFDEVVNTDNDNFDYYKLSIKH